MGPLTVTLGVLAAISLALSTILIITTVTFLDRKSAAPDESLTAGFWPPISILKPLKGADPDLFMNLLACARQDYPRFELVLGAADPDDPSLAVARRLSKTLPGIDIRVVSGAPDLGLNPKVSNLSHLAQAASYDLVLVSDADVRPGPGYLRSLAEEIADPRVGMVTNLLAGIGEHSLGAALENLHLGTFVSPSLAAARSLAGHTCVVGKSMLFRLSDLEAFGGWAAVADVLAEDYVLGRLFQRAGRRVALSPAPLPVVNRRRTLAAFLARHLRWGQMRRRINFTAFLGEILLAPTLWATSFAAVAWHEGSEGVALATLLFLLALQVGGHRYLLLTLCGRPPAWRHFFLLPLKDLLIALLWPIAALKRGVSWRGTRLLVDRGSRLRRPGFASASSPTQPGPRSRGTAMGSRINARHLAATRR